MEQEKIVCFDQYCHQCEHFRTDEHDDPCNECLTAAVNAYSHRPIHYSHREQNYGYPKSIKRHKEYLYEVSYEDLDYEAAFKYYKTLRDIPTGACSCVRNGNWYGRNLDWLYNNQAEFVVRVPRIRNKYASIGVSAGFSALTESFVKSGQPSELYKYVPFQMYDGINEWGVTANINVVPKDYGENIARPIIQEKVELNALMLIRFVLDNFKTAKNAVSYLQNYATIYFPKALHDMDYECHWMIADPNETYILEIVDNQLWIRRGTFMTNFHLYCVAFGENEMVLTPEQSNGEYNPFTVNGITKYGSGLERWNYICDHYDEATSYSGMRSIMNGLIYTKAYWGHPQTSNPFWYSEFVGGNNYIWSPVEQLCETAVAYGEKFRNRSRNNPETWQSVHSVVYDIQDRSMKLRTQEGVQEFGFKL